jgi:hypothetical protein
MKKIVFLILAAIFIGYPVRAGVGTSVFEFLQTDFSTRSGAMAGAFLGMRGDINGLFHNPAGMAYTTERQFGFNYLGYLVDINGGQAGYSQRLKEYGQISASIIYFDYGNFLETDEFANPTGREYGAHDIAFAVSYADDLEPGFKYGITAKYVHSKIDVYTASAIAFDLGLIYDAPFEENLYIGLTLANVGKQMTTYIDTDESLPLSLRIGFTKKLAHLPLEYNAVLNDLNIDEDSFFDRLKKFSLGGEFTLSQMLRLRLGYNNDVHRGLDTGTGAGFAGVSFGFGILYDTFRFDYAFSSFGDLGNVHRFGFSGSLD